MTGESLTRRNLIAGLLDLALTDGRWRGKVPISPAAREAGPTGRDDAAGMTEETKHEPAPVAADAAIAVAVAVTRSCIAVAGRVTAGVAPVLGPVLRTEDWPPRLRALAETGFQQRQRATAMAIDWYHRAVPVVVTDALDQIDVSGMVRDVIEELDLPELVRISAGSLSTEAVHEGRMQAMSADDAVSTWIGRIFGRRRVESSQVAAPAPAAPVVG